MNNHPSKIMTTRSSHQFHMLKTSTPIFFNSNQIPSKSKCVSPPQPLIQKSQTVLIPFNKTCTQTDKKVIRIAKKSKPPAPQKIQLIQHGDEEFARYDKDISPIHVYSEVLDEPIEIVKPKVLNCYQTHRDIYQPHQAIQEAFNKEIIRRPTQCMPASNVVIEQLQSQIKSIQENNISIKNDLNLLLNNLTNFFQQVQKLSETDKLKKFTSRKKASKVRASSLSDITIENFETRAKPKYTSGHAKREMHKKTTVRAPEHSPIQPSRYSRHCSNSIYQRVPMHDEQHLLKEQNKRYSLHNDRVNKVNDNKTSATCNVKSNNGKDSDDVFYSSYAMRRSQVLNEQYFSANSRPQCRKIMC